MIKSANDFTATTQNHMSSIILMMIGIFILYLYRTGKYSKLKKLFADSTISSNTNTNTNLLAPANPFSIPNISIKKAGSDGFGTLPVLPAMPGYEAPKK